MKTALRTFLLATLAAKALPAFAEAAPVDIQFFGDTFLAWHSLKETKTTAKNPVMFSKLLPLMERSPINVVNFEGVASGTTFSLDITKRFHLSMPLYTGRILNKVHINVATLANNHAMDYGYAGLFDSIVSLNNAGILTGGAGKNIEEALKPIIVSTKDANICILSFSRTLPYEFYARLKRPGTANLNFSATQAVIRNCARKYEFTFVLYHWGEELTGTPKDYQRHLAKLSIDNGATAVIGHHPHILQEVEFYRGKPILYSLGNFVFGTRTHSRQEGMAAGFKFSGKKLAYLDLVPINVQNSEVNYIPQLFAPDLETPLKKHLPKDNPCTQKISDFGKDHGGAETGEVQFYRCPII